MPFFFFSPACLPSESTKNVNALIEKKRDVLLPPSSRPNDEAIHSQKLAESKGNRLQCRRILCQEAFFFSGCTWKSTGVYTQCVCKVTIERYLEFKKLGFLEWQSTVPFSSQVLFQTSDART